MAEFDVVVVGSVNQDLTVFTPRHPHPGETVLGRSHRWGGGGKGANQAVAASRLGARTAFVGCTGSDEPGQVLIEQLEAEGVDVSYVKVDQSKPTGLAVITVDDQAENSIVVSPGANLSLTPQHVSECRPIIEEADVVLAQLEIPVESVLEAARITDGIFCLNPAPAVVAPKELMEHVDVLIPNRGELAALSSKATPTGRREVIELARHIEGPRAVVVTLGSEGALIIRDGEVTDVPPAKVDPVDTTGAGDAFCGALAGALAHGDDLEDSVRWATLAGGLATTRAGARGGMPTAEEMEQFS